MSIEEISTDLIHDHSFELDDSDIAYNDGTADDLQSKSLEFYNLLVSANLITDGVDESMTFGDQAGVAASPDDWVTISGGGTVKELRFAADGSGTALDGDEWTDADSDDQDNYVRTADTDEIIYLYAVDGGTVLVGSTTAPGSFGLTPPDSLDDFATSSIVIVGYLDASDDNTTAEVYFASFRPVTNPDETEPDNDFVDLADNVWLYGDTREVLTFSGLDPRKFLFGIAGSDDSDTKIFVLAENYNVDNDEDPENGNKSGAELNTSNAGTFDLFPDIDVATIGVDNQSSNPGDGIFVMIVDTDLAVGSYYNGTDADVIQADDVRTQDSMGFGIVQAVGDTSGIQVEISGYLAGYMGSQFIANTPATPVGDPDKTLGLDSQLVSILSVSVKTLDAMGNPVEGSLAFADTATGNIMINGRTIGVEFGDFDGDGKPQLVTLTGVDSQDLITVNWSSVVDHALLHTNAGAIDWGIVEGSFGGEISDNIGEHMIVDDAGPTVTVTADATPGEIAALGVNLDETIDPDDDQIANGQDNFASDEGESNTTIESGPDQGPGNGDLDDVIVSDGMTDTANTPIYSATPGGFADATDEAIGRLESTAGQISALFGDAMDFVDFGSDGADTTYGTDGQITDLSFDLSGTGPVLTNLVATPVVGSSLDGVDEANRKVYLFEVADGDGDITIIEGRVKGPDGTWDTGDDYVILRMTLTNKNDPGSATIIYENFAPVQHPSALLSDEAIGLFIPAAVGESLSLVYTVTARDEDLDVASNSASVTVIDDDTTILEIDDDGPRTTGSPDAVDLWEDGLTGIGGRTDGDGEAEDTTSTSSVSGQIVAGTDGVKDFGFTSDSDFTDALDALGLKSGGVSLTHFVQQDYSGTDDRLIAVKGTSSTDDVVYEVILAADGTYTITVNLPLDHPNPVPFPATEEDVITIDFTDGLEAFEGDGDPVVFQPDALAMRLEDDTPLATVTKVSLPGGATLYEGNAVAGGNFEDNGSGMDKGADGMPTKATINFSGAFDDTNVFGADGMGSETPAYSLVLTTGLLGTAVETTGNVKATSGGADVIWAVASVGDGYAGVVGGTEIFTITVDSDGKVTFELKGVLDHPSKDTAKEYTLDVLKLDDGQIAIKREDTVIDFDGDTSKDDAQWDIGALFGIGDDAPKADVTKISLPTGVTLYEGNAVAGGNFEGDGSGMDQAADGMPTTATISLAGAFGENHSFGADGMGTATPDYSLVLTMGLLGTAVKTTGNVTAKSGGADVIWAVASVGDGYAGVVGGTEIFTITVDGDGKVTFELKGVLDHPSKDTAKEYTLDVLALDANQIAIKREDTVLDKDGDSDTDAEQFDIGALFGIGDDAPKAMVTTGSLPTGAILYEGNAVAGGNFEGDGSGNDKTASPPPAMTTINLAGAFGDTNSFGADGMGTETPAYSLVLTVAPNSTVQMGGEDATSGGVDVVWTAVAGGYAGFAGSDEIFRITVNPMTGQVTYKLSGTVDHPSKDSTPEYTLDVLALGPNQIAIKREDTVTDFDGDSDTDAKQLDISGLFSIGDDAPLISPDSGGVLTDIPFLKFDGMDSKTIDEDFSYGADGAGSYVIASVDPVVTAETTKLGTITSEIVSEGPLKDLKVIYKSSFLDSQDGDGADADGRFLEIILNPETGDYTANILATAPLVPLPLIGGSTTPGGPVEEFEPDPPGDIVVFDGFIFTDWDAMSSSLADQFLTGDDESPVNSADSDEDINIDTNGIGLENAIINEGEGLKLTFDGDGVSGVGIDFDGPTGGLKEFGIRIEAYYRDPDTGVVTHVKTVTLDGSEGFEFLAAPKGQAITTYDFISQTGTFNELYISTDLTGNDAIRIPEINAFVFADIDDLVGTVNLKLTDFDGDMDTASFDWAIDGDDSGTITLPT